MNILLAFDSFKGCLSAEEVCDAVAKEIGPSDKVISMPLSDGGEGFGRIVTRNFGGRMVKADTFDPLMRPIVAEYGINSENAYIDTATASGLGLLKSSERNVLKATSYGTGILIKNAILRGCRNIHLGMGGSATNDGGKGLLEALEDVPTENVHFFAYHDTNIPFLEATALYGPQKGLAKEDLPIAEQRMQTLYNEYSKHGNCDAPGTGAAGGIGGAMLAMLGATLKNGAEGLLDLLCFEDCLRNENIDLVITGEGKFDKQTLTGKLPFVVAQRINKYNKQNNTAIRTMALVGKTEITSHPLFEKIIAITPVDTPLEKATKKDFALKSISNLSLFKNYF